MEQLAPGPLGPDQAPGGAHPHGDAAEDQLIARGAGKWGDPDFPKTDWIFEHDQDLGEPDTTCEMCEYKIIRFVHHLRHPSGLRLQAGCVCAGHLLGDVEGAQARDTNMRNAAQRLASRRRSVTRLWAELDSPTADLHAIRRRADDLLTKVTLDLDRCDSDQHFLLWLDTICLPGAAAKALAERKLEGIIRLRHDLAYPDWWGTSKGERFETTRGDVVQAFRRSDGLFSYGYQIVGKKMSWSADFFISLRDAKRAGIEELRTLIFTKTRH